MIKTTQFTKAIFIFLTALFSSSFTAQTFIKVNTDIFPKAEKNQKKVVIDVPYSPTDANKKIEIFVGKDMETDKCNQYSLSGSFVKKDLKGWGYDYLVFNSNGNAVSTMKACLEPGKKVQFVYAQGYLTDYNGRMPIVIYIPEDFSVKYKIYKADSEWYEAPEVSEKK
ncbi:ecotin family protein [Epilithonimonas pallida]|uniref:Ecotin n=1 Tax=Epilithonimonas pallida TaxID=373671 RepID=A0ABY1R782_9FLAO|nr:ecotin family protein [Epilithonimonas pallida]SMP96901.1 ecotin [Epilithonimonas pallida]